MGCNSISLVLTQNYESNKKKKFILNNSHNVNPDLPIDGCNIQNFKCNNRNYMYNPYFVFTRQV